MFDWVQKGKATTPESDEVRLGTIEVKRDKGEK